MDTPWSALLKSHCEMQLSDRESVEQMSLDCTTTKTVRDVTDSNLLESYVAIKRG